MLSKLKGIDVALYIFLLTGFGYLTAFLFGWGYNSYFGIPISFIDLSVANVTKSIALLGVFFTFIVMYVTFFQEKSDIKTLFTKLFSINVTNRNWNISLQILCMVGIIFFLFGWFIVKEATRINFIGIVLLFGMGFCHLKKFEKLFLAVWVILMLIIPYMVGVSYAMKQHEFYLVGNTTDYLVIDFYNDKAIAAKFNKKQKVLYPNFKLITVDSIAEHKNNLRLVRVDKLKIERVYSIK
ncbi:hypothetical protein SAMN05444673_2806 [Bacillus sp. OV166]|uniref:hypothetical protein n=1 Tax=Bacillus sp. OV166 TaxID=1882763 RepID=UPI000A2AEDEB|nr:hypothetical protein [Bacillus sp. OV166]SMQ77478.1 hypothetical protein SAMN05444673_2806 [Bacillus sp. OV166]